VVEVDLARKRIALTMKLDAPTGAAKAASGNDNRFRPAARGEQPRSRAPEPAAGGNAMAAAFAKLQGRR